MKPLLAQAGFLEMVCLDATGAVAKLWKVPQ